MMTCSRGIDIDVVVGNDFCYSSYDTALVRHGDAHIPAYRSGGLADFKIVRIQQSRDFLDTNLTCCQVPCNFDKIRDHSRAGGIAPGAASIEHLHANLVADQENCIIHAHFKVEAGEA